MGYFYDGMLKAADMLLNMDAATFSAIEATLASTACALLCAMTFGLPLGFLIG